MTHGGRKESRETVSNGVQMLDLVEKAFKASIINMFKEIKEIVL